MRFLVDLQRELQECYSRIYGRSLAETQPPENLFLPDSSPEKSGKSPRNP
jgi:hypothetical protein